MAGMISLVKLFLWFMIGHYKNNNHYTWVDKEVLNFPSDRTVASASAICLSRSVFSAASFFFVTSASPMADCNSSCLWLASAISFSRHLFCFSTVAYSKHNSTFRRSNWTFSKILIRLKAVYIEMQKIPFQCLSPLQQLAYRSSPLGKNFSAVLS